MTGTVGTHDSNINIKALIAEVIGLIGGFLWARHTHWDYEPTILVAVSSIGLIISILLLLFKEKNSELSSKANIDVTNIKPIDIYNQINSVPLFQREATANNYVGMNIRWALNLFHIYKSSNNKISVRMKDDKYEFLSIDFKIDIDNYPIFKIAENNKRFEVSGKIIECSHQYVYTLEVATIKEL